VNQPSGSYLKLLDGSELVDDFAESFEKEDDFLHSLT
jgi:hypothetical protein